ncbi:MAG: SNF2 helicase-associated domain-containing protein, partial [Cyanobacteria bacterium P01_F01_bin.4]
MVVLHGSWLSKRQRFLLWGETWRRINPDDYGRPDLNETADLKPHPYCLTYDELLAFLKQPSPTLDLVWLTERAKSRWKPYAVALPTQLTETLAQPQHSGTPLADAVLYPWQIEGLMLPATAALKLLNGLPLGMADGTVGADLRYWSHVTRWSLDLMSRGKFTPKVSADKGGAIAAWHLLLDSAVDQTRLRQFSEQMPLASRLYGPGVKATKGIAEASPLQAPFPTASQTLLRSFLETLIDAQVRATAKEIPLPASTPLSKDLPLRDWISALAAHKDPHFSATPAGLVRLNEALHTWTAPLQNMEGDTQKQLRTCFILEPPPPGELEWTLHYTLQSLEDDHFKVDAATIWAHPVDAFEHSGRAVEAPQETLLGGLGRAARLYEPIKQTLAEQSPLSCPLDPVQAYDFIKVTSWRLMDNGFGVVLPANLADPNEITNGSRLGLRVKATAPTRSKQRLGLQSLLNFRWELSIGGQSVTKEEFDELAAQQTPLVEINGQWVELRSQDIKAVQDFFKNRQDQNKLSIEDVLRISTGDNKLIDKLPVVDFQATG